MSMDPMISALIGDIYDAAMAPAMWPAVLDRLRDRFSASVVGLSTEDDSSTGFSVYYIDTRVDPDFIGVYQRDYGLNRNTNAGAAFYPLMPVAQPILRTALQDDAGFVSTDMYQSWMRPYRVFYLALTKLMSTSNRLVLLQVARAREDGDFGSDDMALLDLLAPHFRRAVEMQHRFALADAGRITLDCLPWGILTVDRTGRVLTLNEAASHVLEANDGLSLRHGELIGASAAQTQALQAAIRQACFAAAGEAPPPEALALPRPSGRRPLTLLIAAVREPTRPGQPPTVAVFVDDPERRVEPPADVLRRLYGLSPAEAALTLALLDGSGLADAAGRLGIGLATAKTQLHAAFGKTGTRRQAQLVGLILKGPAALAVTPGGNGNGRPPHPQKYSPV